MDLKRPVDYRGFSLNTVTKVPGGGMDGCLIERCDYSAVRGIGYTEKRSAGDGRDASDIYLDARTIQMSGTVYGSNRARLHDTLQLLRSTLTPTASFTDNPGAYGYVPLSFEEPTENTFDWPSGYRTLYVRARSLQTPSFQIVRDADGGAENRGGGVSWAGAFDCKDPRVYASPDVFVDFVDDASVSPVAPDNTLPNRGDYPAPLNVLLVIAPQALPGYWTLTTGGSVMKITIPKSTNTQVIRYNGYLKVLTIEELGLEILRMDCLTFTSQTTHPLVLPGSQVYSWTSVWSGGGVVYQTIPLAAGSRIFYSEAFG